ncbi:MAG: hypothetical protein ACTH0E_04470 [Candidatus Microbacterium stercoravium]
MTSTTTRTLFIRSGAGLAALSMLALAGCGSANDAATFQTGAGGASEEMSATPAPTEEAAAGGESVEPGFVYDDISKNVTSTANLRPENDQVVVPNGTLTINSVQEVSIVKGEDLGLGTVDGGYGAPEGEALRVVDVSFAPNEEFPDSDAPTSDLSIEVGGAQEHLYTLDGEQDHRILVSAAEDGTTQLIVSSEGHEQQVDVLTGERADDDVAAAYYLSTPRQEPHHEFPIESDRFPTKSTTGPDEDVTTAYSFQVDSATLSAWTAEDGWAEPDQAWLVVDWKYEVTAEHSIISGRIDRFDAALAIKVGDDVTQDKVHDEDKNRHAEGNRSTSVSVPIETADVTVSVSGGVVISMSGGSGLQMAGETTGEFASDELKLSFPQE